MKARLEWNWPLSHARSSSDWVAALRQSLHGLHVNWYQVAVVALATFAISMDLMFPPVRVAIGPGLDVYAGHLYTPLSSGVAVQVDIAWLAVELLVIIAAAIVGWHIGTAASERRKTPRDQA